MRNVVIKTGVYGHRIAAGRVQPVAKGECVTVPDGEAARLVGLGIASYADVPEKAPDAPPVPPSEGSEPPQAPQDTTGEKEPAEGATDGEKADQDNVNVARLERMPKGDLEQMAKDMGVDISGARNNRERAELIAAAMTDEDDDVPPDLEDEDIVR